MKPLVAAISPPEIAALAGSLAIYTTLIGSSLLDHKEGRGGSSLLVASLLGVFLSFAALLGPPYVLYAALAYFAILLLSIMVPVLLQGLREKQWRWPAPVIWLQGRPKILLYAMGLILVATGGTLVGSAVLGRKTTVTTLAAASGRYRISGTCVNGSCYVNECRTPATCGSDNGGEAAEETAVDIVCQTRGEAAEAPNGRRSIVWDRLSTNLYVSDLFVSGTRAGKFDPALARCADG